MSTLRHHDRPGELQEEDVLPGSARARAQPGVPAPGTPGEGGPGEPLPGSTDLVAEVD
jgi:hypothetical protein